LSVANHFHFFIAQTAKKNIQVSYSLKVIWLLKISRHSFNLVHYVYALRALPSFLSYYLSRKN